MITAQIEKFNYSEFFENSQIYKSNPNTHIYNEDDLKLQLKRNSSSQEPELMIQSGGLDISGQLEKDNNSPIQELLLEQNLIMKYISSSNYSLFESISETLYFTPQVNQLLLLYSEQLLTIILGRVKLIYENKINDQTTIINNDINTPHYLKELLNDFTLFSDYLFHPYLKKFDYKNLYLLSDILQCKINVYYNSQYYLEKEVYGNKYSLQKKQINIYRNEQGDYLPLFQKKFMENSKICQQLIYQILSQSISDQNNGSKQQQQQQQNSNNYKFKLLGSKLEQSNQNIDIYDKAFIIGNQQSQIMMKQDKIDAQNECILNNNKNMEQFQQMLKQQQQCSNKEINKSNKQNIFEFSISSYNKENSQSNDQILLQNQNIEKQIIQQQITKNDFVRSPQKLNQKYTIFQQQQCSSQLMNEVRVKSKTQVCSSSSSKGIKLLENKESEKRYSGKLKFFDEKKQFGFFILDEDESNIFVHQDDLEEAGITLEVLRKYKQELKTLKVSFKSMLYVGKKGNSKKAVDIIHILQ